MALVLVVISAEDSLKEASIVESSGYPALDESALKLFRESNFKSPVCGGKKTEFEFVQPVKFNLRD